MKRETIQPNRDDWQNGHQQDYGDEVHGVEDTLSRVARLAHAKPQPARVRGANREPSRLAMRPNQIDRPGRHPIIE